LPIQLILFLTITISSDTDNQDKCIEASVCCLTIQMSNEQCIPHLRSTKQTVFYNY